MTSTDTTTPRNKAMIPSPEVAELYLVVTMMVKRLPDCSSFTTCLARMQIDALFQARLLKLPDINITHQVLHFECGNDENSIHNRIFDEPLVLITELAV